MYLTDHEDKVLQNLRDCVAANFPSSTNVDVNAGNGTAAVPADDAVAANQQTNDGLFDPEDADSCDDLDEFLAPPSNANTDTWDFVSALVSIDCLPLTQHRDTLHPA